MTTVTSVKNIKLHLKTVKEEYGRLLARKLNGLPLDLEEVKDFRQHYQYVKKLVQEEHLKQAFKGLTTL